MKKQQHSQVHNLKLKDLFIQAFHCRIKVVGTIKEIFQHKKYITEVWFKESLVLRCFKRYSDYEALNEVISMNFKNIDLNIGQFPSKYQIVKKQQTRMIYFEEMLNTILSIYCQKMTNETNRRLLSILYVFLQGEDKKEHPPNLQILNNDIDEGNAENIRNKASNHLKKFSHNVNPQVESKDDQIDITEGRNIKKFSTFTQDAMTKIKNKRLDSNNDLQRFQQFISREFLIKFEEEDNWKERYLKIQNSCLLIYKHKNENHFTTQIQLYQAKIEYLHRQKNMFDHFCEKMQFNHQPTFRQDKSILTISHEYDYKKLLIKLPKSDQEQDYFSSLEATKFLLSNAAHFSHNRQNFDGVFSPIGKLFMIIHRINFKCSNKKVSPIIYLAIKIPGFEYKTKKMTYSNSTVLINQAFAIPISNSFANVILEMMIIENDGIIRHETQQKCIGRYKFCFADFISYPSGYGIQKMHAYAGLDNQILSDYETIIQLTISNYSSSSSIYADSFANQNDGVMLSGLKSTSDTEELVVTVDRVLRVIGSIALFIQAFWRNVYLFKYPIMGYIFFVFLFLNFMFGSASVLFQILIAVIIASMTYHIPFVHLIITQLLSKYIFSYIHESFRCPLSLSTKELKFLKFANNLNTIRQQYRLNINGKLQKTEETKNKKYNIYCYERHGKTFRVKEELPGIIQKVFEVKKIVEIVLRLISAAINAIQKVCNIFSWADPRRSLIIFIILMIASSVGNLLIVRAIGCLFCAHRLIKGKKFYQEKHYVDNRKIAVFGLRYIINKSFSHLVKDKRINSTELVQIVNIFKSIYLPVSDEQKLKKLRLQIEQIIGVYIDPEDLLALSQNKMLRLVDLVQIIETCESRLKIQSISGKEGISNQYQQLKFLSRQELVMDLWVESLVINFVFNIPSQLYTTFRKIRSEDSIKCQVQSNIGQKFVKIKI